MEEYSYGGRKYLSGKNRQKIQVDMEEVYRRIDAGMTVKEVAKELGVSQRTLYRHHEKYQEKAKLMSELEDKKWEDQLFSGLQERELWKDK